MEGQVCESFRRGHSRVLVVFFCASLDLICSPIQLVHYIINPSLNQHRFLSSKPRMFSPISSSFSRSGRTTSSLAGIASVASSSALFSHDISSIATTSSHSPIFPSSSFTGNYSIRRGAGPRTSSRGGHNGGYGDDDDNQSWPKPTSSVKSYDGSYDGGYGGGYTGKAASTSSKPYGDGHAVPTSSKAWGGKGYGDDDDEKQCVTSTFTSKSMHTRS